MGSEVLDVAFAPPDVETLVPHECHVQRTRRVGQDLSRVGPRVDGVALTELPIGDPVVGAWRVGHRVLLKAADGLYFKSHYRNIAQIETCTEILRSKLSNILSRPPVLTNLMINLVRDGKT